MNIWGTLINRNEGAKAIKTMQYHLDKCGFTGIVFIDNGSTDNSVSLVTALNDSRIIISIPSEIGLHQGKIKTRITRELFLTQKADAVIPIDCDMLWDIDQVRLKKYMEDGQPCVLCPNYMFLTEYESREDWHNFHDDYFKYLLFKYEEPVCYKAIIFRSFLRERDMSIVEGDHFLLSPFGDFIGMENKCTDIFVREYPVLDHDDYVRKTVNSSIGRILGQGIQFVQGKSIIGTHTAKDLDILSRTGNLREKFRKEFLLTEEDKLKKMKNDKRIIYDGKFEESYN
jgi:glycosyltransferase involved in cell wall biosynthesis